MPQSVVPAQNLKKPGALDIIFQRRFSREGVHPFEELSWKKLSMKVRLMNGTEVQRELEFPESWSENASSFEESSSASFSPNCPGMPDGCPEAGAASPFAPCCDGIWAASPFAGGRTPFSGTSCSFFSLSNIRITFTEAFFSSAPH